ncbi:MAG: WbqC family protein [Flavobacteriales bacterium]|nr:WbqC family protein [Flavobacteriales bacterium]
MVPVLSAFYFGSVEHYRLLAKHPKVILDVGEHYVRQSYRTRTRIVGPNGVQDLSVQVAHDHGSKMAMHSVGLSTVETWPQQHAHAIRSAYGKTPWGIHYIEAVEALITAPHQRLIDLDLASLRLCMKWLGLTTEVEVSETYVEVSGELFDLRTSFHPKRPLPPGVLAAPSYPQVFADRHGFSPRLSVIDLLCNCGPEAKRIVRA